MKKLYTLFLLICFFCSSIHSQEQKNKVVLDTFETILSTMKQNYFDQNYNNLPWNELSKETRKKILLAEDSARAYTLITEQLKKLGHSHLVFMPPSEDDEQDFTDYLGGGTAKDVPFRFIIYKDTLLITEVSPSTDAYEKGLRAGMMIQKVGEDQVTEILKSNDSHIAISSVFLHYAKPSLTLSGVDAKQKPFDLTFSLPAYTGKFVSFGNIEGVTDDVRSKVLKDNIGYVYFNMFLFSQVQQTIAIIHKFKEQNCKGVIIDLRNNPGGIGMLASAIAKEFCKESYSLGVQHTTADNGVKELRFPVQAQSSYYDCPVVILINEQSASTSEVMAIGMQENKSATIVGMKSSGMALPSLILNLDDGSLFQYPIADFKTPQNKSIEGLGVVPDIEIQLQPEKIAQGEDDQLNKAIEVILKAKK